MDAKRGSVRGLRAGGRLRTTAPSNTVAIVLKTLPKFEKPLTNGSRLIEMAVGRVPTATVTPAASAAKDA